MEVECAAALSTAPEPERALEEVCASAGMVGADLAVAFIGGAWGSAGAERIGAALQSRIGPRTLLGCTVAGTIGVGREIEQGPSLALWTASLPGADLTTFFLPGVDQDAEAETALLPEAAPGDTLLVLADPFGTTIGNLLSTLPRDVQVLGALASGGRRPGTNRLLRDRDAHAGGTVGVRLRGVHVHPVVSQGCRPIGRPFLVTRAERNVIQALAGKPPLAQLQELIAGLPAGDQRLARQGLHLGCAIDEYKDEHGRGDFVIRNVIGVDPSSGAMAVGDQPRVGQTVQFHVRDGSSARDDFHALLRAAEAEVDARGALLFSCNGRGAQLFGEPHVDPRIVHAVLGDLPLAGCFAAGELGPVGGTNFLHGYTASLAVFCA